jgi:hypothetical protein
VDENDQLRQTLERWFQRQVVGANVLKGNPDVALQGVL